MADAYVSSVKHAAIAQWAASTGYTVGQYVRQLATPTVGNERVFKCTTAGTSGASEPSWTLTNNGTTTDNTVTWTQVGGQQAEQVAGNWRAALPTISAAKSLLATAATDTVWIAHDHSELRAAAYTLSTDGDYICVRSDGASLPPTNTDITTGAVVGTSGNNSLTVSAQGYFQGITFVAGDSATGVAAINLGGLLSLIQFVNCRFELRTTSTSLSSRIFINQSNTNYGMVEWVNCKVKFGATAQLLCPGFGKWTWRDTASAIDTGGSVPTTLMTLLSTNGVMAVVRWMGLDLSGYSGTLGEATSSAIDFEMSDCQINASSSLTPSTGTIWDGNKFFNSDDSTNNRNYRFAFNDRDLAITPSITIYVHNGGSDGVTNYSLACVTGASGATRGRIQKLPRIVKRYNTTGGAVTLTIELIFNRASLPANNQVWMDVATLDNSGNTRRAIHSTQASILDTGTLTATTTDWDDGLTARANSTVYTVGQVIKLASNPGRVFFCTTAGTSSGSEPAGYASAVDGGSVTDGTAVFRAGIRAKLSVSFTPARKGMVQAEIRSRLASETFYVDPKMTIA